VFGPNNFPFAFNSVAGGGFVAAIAAGNPVIAKANTGHPGATQLLAELVFGGARQRFASRRSCNSSTGRRRTSG
jgi:acyl-CoA reductase-like NAD-dependent aldehyde dehydrogenase